MLRNYCRAPVSSSAFSHRPPSARKSTLTIYKMRSLMIIIFVPRTSIPMPNINKSIELNLAVERNKLTISLSLSLTICQRWVKIVWFCDDVTPRDTYIYLCLLIRKWANVHKVKRATESEAREQHTHTYQCVESGENDVIFIIMKKLDENLRRWEINIEIVLRNGNFLEHQWCNWTLNSSPTHKMP